MKKIIVLVLFLFAVAVFFACSDDVLPGDDNPIDSGSGKDNPDIREIIEPGEIQPNPEHIVKSDGVSRLLIGGYGDAYLAYDPKNGDIYINPTGNPGMSKGGSGDILAGMVASYCAQGIKPEDAAAIAVYLHGLSGDIAADRYSQSAMIPSDMLEILRELLTFLFAKKEK